MSLKTDLYACLKTLADAYPSTAPITAARPYITFQGVGGKEHESLADGGGAPRTRVQIDVWSTTAAEAESMAATAKVLLRAAFKIGEVLDNPDDFEVDTRLYRASFDVAIWV